MKELCIDKACSIDEWLNTPRLNYILVSPRPRQCFIHKNRAYDSFRAEETMYSLTVLNLRKLKKIKYFAIFKNGMHSLEPGELPSNSASHKAPHYA